MQAASGDGLLNCTARNSTGGAKWGAKVNLTQIACRRGLRAEAQLSFIYIGSIELPSSLELEVQAS